MAIFAGRELPLGYISLPGEHDETGVEDSFDRRAVRNGPGLRHPEAPAKSLPSSTVSNKAALDASTGAHHR